MRLTSRAELGRGWRGEGPLRTGQKQVGLVGARGRSCSLASHGFVAQWRSDAPQRAHEATHLVGRELNALRCAEACMPLLLQEAWPSIAA